MNKTVVRYGLAILIAVVALWLSFKDVDLESLVAHMRSANFWWILLGVAVQFVSHAVRAWRWKLFLEPVKAYTSFWSAYKALLAGYGMNNIVPRAGEIVRPVMLAKRESISIPATLATIVIERISDLFGLVVFGFASLYFFEDELTKAFPTLADSITLVFGITTILFIVSLAILVNETRTAALIRWMTRPLPERFKEKIHHAALAFTKGLGGVKKRAFTSFVLGTIAIWMLYAVSMYASLFAFDDPQLRAVGFIGCILLQLLSGVAFIVPTPGGTGSYHAIISQSLRVVFLVSGPVSLAYATLTHGANYLATTIIGIAIMAAEGVSLTQLKKQAEQEARPTVLSSEVSPP